MNLIETAFRLFERSHQHGWAFPTRKFQAKLFGNNDGETGIDEDFATRGFHNVGAWIMGRNMFAV